MAAKQLLPEQIVSPVLPEMSPVQGKGVDQPDNSFLLELLMTPPTTEGSNKDGASPATVPEKTTQFGPDIVHRTGPNGGGKKKTKGGAQYA